MKLQVCGRHHRCPIIKLLLKIFKIHRKIPMLGLFVIKLQAFRSETLLEKTSAQVFSCEYCEIFKNTYLEEY